jgi:YidC/Oxa1 family membrane protein insertase
MQALFQTILYQPIFNIFVALYNLVPDVGFAVVVLTILLKLVLYPFTNSSLISQKKLSNLQPKLEELKKQHKGEQQKLAQETMKLYKENKVNPLASCLPLLIQLPIFLALFWVLKDGINATDFNLLYPFIESPNAINPISLGFIDLGKQNIVLALLAGGAQFWQAKMMQTKQAPKTAGEGAKDENMLSSMNKNMLYFMPVLTVIIGLQLPGGVALYWFLSTLLTAVQQLVVFKKHKLDQENVEVLPANLK